MSLQFDLPQNNSSIIKVIGVGGGGSNAVNHMFNQGITGVDFVICNTDAQALDISPVSNKIPLGGGITEGRGAGSDPEVGRSAARENEQNIKEMLSDNTKMVFVTAGMGGGTGTGAAPIIAEMAREMGILTVGIVTTPFSFEGKSRWKKAQEGIENLQKSVDTSLVISNDKLKDTYGNLPLSSAFSYADDILATAAKGIAEIITVPGYVNVDFEDVKAVMEDSGKAILGSATGEGSERATEAVRTAVDSPLLSENDINGANYILLNITSGTKEILMDEITAITDYIHDRVGDDADVIWGHCHDESIGDQISVTIIATSFEERGENASDVAQRENPHQQDQKVYKRLEDEPASTNNKVEEKAPNSAQIPIDFGEDSTSQSRKSENEQERSPERRDNSNAAGEKDVKKVDYKSNEGIDYLERVPAYLRKNVKFQQVPHSSESGISRYTLGSRDSEEENNDSDKSDWGRNNSFLHDNVD